MNIEFEKVIENFKENTSINAIEVIDNLFVRWLESDFSASLSVIERVYVYNLIINLKELVDSINSNYKLSQNLNFNNHANNNN